MIKVLLNKWFLLALLLTISLSTFSVVTYKNVRREHTGKCSRGPAVDQQDMLDLTRQFTSYVSCAY